MFHCLLLRCKKRISPDAIYSFELDTTAASHFNSAAEQFLQTGSALDAAQCYEEVYKSYQQSKHTGERTGWVINMSFCYKSEFDILAFYTLHLEKALLALEKAASLYESHDRQMSRAANVYVKLAEQYKKDNSTSKDLGKAVAVRINRFN